MSEETEKRSALASGSLMISLMMVLVIAMVLVIGAVGVVAVSGGSGGATSGGSTTVSVTLTEFAITMEPATVPAGKVTLQIHNAGAAEHNVAVPSLSKRTANIAVGGNVTLELGNLSDPVELICEIAGHKESGMVATLGIGGDGGTATAATVPMTNDQMDAAMEAVAKLFPAKTSGTGNQELIPTIAADGTKVFDLTAKIVDWEVEPGKFVKGWTYNGQIPGPVLRANVGDKVRINLKNELTESTSLHLHGIRVPNSMDGVDPYTQPATKPGESFSYEFTAKETAVGMYHSHHNGQVQIPNGLAGALIIGDWKDISMRAAAGRTEDADGDAEQEVVMVLNDAGTIGLSLNGKSFPATQPYTMKLGESMVVHYYNEGLMPHPMHMHQPHGLVVAKDGKVLPQPFFTDTLNVAPGERWTVVYTALDKGVWAWHCHILNHAETPQGMKYMVTAVIVS
ncbi:MAG: multicopper oxidase domain-containing protein [Acidimicrobiales bacterium]